MRGLLALSCAAFLAAIVVAAPKPASALPAASTIAQSKANAGLVQDVGRRYYKRRYYRPYRYRRYGYRPYRYRGWGYYGPYYGRPYYRGWGYGPYWRRPGVNIWLGF